MVPFNASWRFEISGALVVASILLTSLDVIKK